MPEGTFLHAVNDEVLQLQVEPIEGAAGQARRAVRAWMAGLHLSPVLVDDVLLVVSELVTNAALHARTTARVVARWDGEHVLIEVFDTDSRPPVILNESPTVGGWGLRLVDQLSRTWGCDAGSDGKRVWAQVGETR